VVSSYRADNKIISMLVRKWLIFLRDPPCTCEGRPVVRRARRQAGSQAAVLHSTTSNFNSLRRQQLLGGGGVSSPLQCLVSNVYPGDG
jgi:hypothetical protein